MANPHAVSITKLQAIVDFAHQCKAPITVPDVADLLHVCPSSARSYLSKLVDIGFLERTKPAHQSDKLQFTPTSKTTIPNDIVRIRDPKKQRIMFSEDGCRVMQSVAVQIGMVRDPLIKALFGDWKAT